MRLLFFSLALAVVLAASLIACAPLEETDLAAPDSVTPGEGDRSDGGEVLSTRMAIIDWSWVDLSTDEAIEKYSRAELIVFEAQALWSGNFNAGAIEAMKAKNPKLKVLGYFPAHGSWLYWGDADRYPVGSYGGDWFQATKPYWSRTTTGDTMMCWPGTVLLDVLDPDCREAMAGVIAEHWQAHQNVFDGIFWDHFNPFLWVPLELAGREGDMDLDGDGIPHRQDDDEMAAYRQASEDLIRSVREKLPTGTIQVANGNRAPQDSVFAGLLDGMMYEDFPSYAFSGDKMAEALDPANPNNLFAARTWPRTENGGPYLLLSNKFHMYYRNEDGGTQSMPLADFNRLTAMLTDNLVAYHSADERYEYGWPAVDCEMGAPLGGVDFDGAMIRREFQNGRIQVEMTSGDMPCPFNFWIYQGPGVLQEFVLP